MTDPRVTVLDPVARPRDRVSELTRVPGLQGAAVGLLNNGWRSWSKVLGHLDGILRDREGVAEVHEWGIPVSVKAPDEVIHESARVCDLCVVGLGH